MPARANEQTQKPSVDLAVVKALGHPLRMELLTRLNERVASPVELARELGESVQLVSYHVRILRELEFVELVRTTPRRGAVEHHYRATRRPYLSDADVAALPPNVRSAIAGTILENIVDGARAAHAAGAFDDEEQVHVSYTDLVFDQVAWEQLAAKLNEVLDLAMQLQAEAMPRLQDGADEFTARVAMLLYPVPKSARRRGR